jgi:biotin carboxylase
MERLCNNQIQALSLNFTKMVHEQTRREVIHTTLRALNEYVIDGITTTIPFHKKLLQHKGFQNGRVHTKFVEEDFLGQERST